MMDNNRQSQLFWGESAKLPKAVITSVMSVRMYSWNNSALTGRIVTKFDI